MTGKWKKCKLGDVLVLNYGKSLPERKRVEGKIPVYSSAGLTGYHNETLVNSEGLIIGRKGTVGKIYYSKTPFFCIDTAYYILPEETKYYLNFIYYLLKTIGLEELNEDSAVPRLNRNTAYSQDILLPPLPEQRAIASVLSSLDDKIDLLHRQNKTLEAMAETLFRQWFEEEADEGWEEGTLGDVASFHNGKKRPDDIIEGNIPIYGGNGILGYSDKSNNEGVTVIIGRVGAYCGSLYIERNPVWISDNALVAKPINKEHSSFLFFLLKSLQLNEIAEGSSHPLLTQNLLKSIQIILPPEHRIEPFVYQADTWFNKIDKNNKQIRTLEKLRDTLLSKLMSGEARVEYGVVEW
ncbi:restriction endonuclease subunit S [Methanococcoides burtonii]|uniref:Restriction modification system DNA specificity subunit n=1 Tax=Methanococcoides burtonii (strain DSM 6242 / NBRC 107633 / OCM 468 / ACE-M) TaxID=259564 RepID=Q12WN6_METBU|nr:restriction endonuclease subunit S [Methanococcoides burtonii]ABE52140.1 Restriction modification system DNA specificity subunit [Methanococcoides burtonii DSM 6242]